MNHIGSAERETERVPSVHGGLQKAKDVASYDHASSHPWCHDAGVMEWLTHRCMVVIGH